MEMQFKNEIKKLADVVVWADNWITNLKDGLTEEEIAEDEAVNEFETIKKVVLESMERHAVYTNALNKDIADKAAKIELLEKEIEGRKEGYWALKEKKDDIENELDNTKKELEAVAKARDIWFDKVKRQKENLDGINKTLEIRTKENESLVKVRNNLNKEIEAHESENGRLTEKIIELKKENSYLKKELNETCTYKELDLKGHNRREMALVNDLADKNDEIKKLKESIEYYKNQERIRTDQLRATERKVDELWKEIEKFTKGEEDDHGKSGFKRYIEHLIEEEERAVPERFKERLNKEITEIFTKEEETEVKGVGRTNSGRYPWGAKVNDIPCGEDAIE